MRKPALAATLVLVVWPAMETAAQSSGSTTLVLRVSPEARIDPPQVALAFFVSADGTSDVTAASASLAARVRALSGQAIRVTAQLSSLHGPAGPVPESAVSWTGSAINANGAARQALCSSGVFAPGAAQDLVASWQTSGVLTCALNFQLAQPRSLLPGAYSGVVNLAVVTQ